MNVDDLRAAFDAILQRDFPAAQRHLAALQVDHYGQKPWRPGVPITDALDRPIVFAENGARFYIVKDLGYNGQIRKLMFGPRYVGAFDVVEVRAPTAERAQSLMAAYAFEIKKTSRASSSMVLPDGWVALRYTIGDGSLD